jgi:ATP-binding cassette subfamily C protein
MTSFNDALKQFRGAFLGVAVFSAVMNILMLTGPLFMLQVYDRVLSSRSSATLVVLLAIVVFLLGMMGVLDYYRGRVLARIGAGVQALLDQPIFDAVLRQAQHPILRERPAGGLRSLESIRTVLASPAMGSVFDLPWAPFYVAILFVFHSWFGWFAIAGAVIVVILALANQIRTRKTQAQANAASAEAETQAEATRKSIETLRGLGMVQIMAAMWRQKRAEALQASVHASDVGGGLTAATKAVRMILQSAILGLGAYLVLIEELTPGAMIAGSILLGRALAPVEQVIGQWAQFQRAMAGKKDIDTLLADNATPSAPMTTLPRPAAQLMVKGLFVAPPGEQTPTLNNINFAANAGDVIAVIGPSAAGKSSLANALAGIWPIGRGEIRLGGAELRHYDKDKLGRYIGYLPQNVELFSGTIAQNIARFDPQATSQDIIYAAKQAEAHHLILQLPEGYDTKITDGGGRLSGGQRQRIGLARAFYGNPVFMILDEPNSNLDEPGLEALSRALISARKGNKIVTVMSHRPSVLVQCNKVIVIDKGQMQGFGPRDEMLEKFLRAPGAKPAAHTPVTQKTVSKEPASKQKTSPKPHPETGDAT